MKRNSESFSDELEMQIDYLFDRSEEMEDFGNYTSAVPYIYTELKEVRIKIGKEWVDVLPVLSENQKTYILKLLNYEE